MSEKAKQSFQLNFQVTFVTLIVSNIFRLIQWKRNLMLLAAAVMFVAGCGYARKPASTTIDREYTPECSVAVGGAYVPDFMFDGRFRPHKSRISKNISSL
jgi:hypothetical protein